MKKKRSPEALVLIFLRLAFQWTVAKLAAALGFSREESIRRYESGERPLSREQLETLVEPLGAPPEAIDILLWAHGQIVPSPETEAVATSPLDLTPRERWRIFRAGLAAGWALAVRVIAELTQEKRVAKVAAARVKAEALVARLLSFPPEERQTMIALFPEFRHWSVVERLCLDSGRAAANAVEDALELANLALHIAGWLPGGPEVRARAAGFCHGYVGNAWRVATEFDRAGQELTLAWELWRAGEAAGWMPIEEWRLLDCEASLRREQHRFPEALERLDQALTLCRQDSLATGRILVNKANVLLEMGDHPGALSTLKRATPAIEASADPHLLFALRFNTALELFHLKFYEQAAALLPEVRERAIKRGKSLELNRLLWLASKVAVVQGRKEEALAGLNQVVHEFLRLELAYEAALAALDLAVLYLEGGRTIEVKELAVALAPIFKAKGIAREALAALTLFCEAAQREAATVELAKQVITLVEAARKAPPA